MAADLVPLGKSSLSVRPGSLMWTWRSTHPGRMSESPWSTSSSPRRDFFTATILPFSPIPRLNASSRPRKNTRPLMTRTRRLHLPAHDGPPRIDLGEDLRLERVDPRGRIEPRIGEQARLHTGLGEEVRRIEVLFDRHLGKQNPTVGSLGDAQAVHSDRDVSRHLLRLLHLNESRWGEDAHFDRDAVPLVRAHGREPRVVRRRGFGRLLDRLCQGEERLRITDASAQLALGMTVDRHNGA